MTSKIILLNGVISTVMVGETTILTAQHKSINFLLMAVNGPILMVMVLAIIARA